MRGSRIFCQLYLVLSLFYSLQRGSNGFIAEKTILILYQGSRGVHYFPGGGGCQTFSRWGGAPYPRLDLHMGNVILTGQYLSQSRF